MKICFVLPRIYRKPIGGYKIVYEYANRLTQRGHDVQILYLNDVMVEQHRALPEWGVRQLAYAITTIEPKWFELDRRIKKISSLNHDVFHRLGELDAVIATAVETVQYVDDNFENVQKIYLIQDYENWNVSDRYVRESFSRRMKKIVIATWLKDLVDEYSVEKAVVIKNAIDLHQYKMVCNPKDRNRYSVGFLYNEASHKGVKVLLEALQIVKRDYPYLEVNCFGTCEKTMLLPEWISYIYKASVEQTVEIYNRSRVFACATTEEGFGLTGLEAMACGATLASTDYLGVHEYAVDGYNALLSEVGNAEELASNIERLMTDDELCYTLVKNGLESVKNMSWDEATSKFEQVLKSK